MNAQATLSLALLCLSAWSAFALLLDRRGDGPINRHFAAVIALFCVPQAFFYTQLITPRLDAPLLGLAAQAAIWLKGPMLWTLVLLVVDRPLRGSAWHFIAFPLAIAGMWIWPGASLEWNVAGMISMLGYLAAAAITLYRARRRLFVICAEFLNTSYYWLACAVAGLLVLVSVDIVVMVATYAQRAYPMDFIKMTNWLVASYFIVIAFLSVHRPEALSGATAAADTSSSATVSPAATAAPDRTWRELDASLARTLSTNLADLMAREQLYRQHELSLSMLASRLGITIHQASELLNVQHRASFYEFLNEHRLRHAVRLLEDPGCELRVLDIAFESGFGNKNSFYRSFREAYATTPVEFRRQALTRGVGTMPATALSSQSQKPS